MDGQNPYGTFGGTGYEAYTDADGGKSGRGHGSCMIMLFGCILFPSSLVMLGWNEKTAVCQTHILMQAEDSAVIGECGNAGAAEGKFTFFSCAIDDNGTQSFNPMTSFNLPGLQELVKFNSVAAAQSIEMYQCIETKEEVKTGSQNSGRRRKASLLDEGAKVVDEDQEDAELSWAITESLRCQQTEQAGKALQVADAGCHLSSKPPIGHTLKPSITSDNQALNVPEVSARPASNPCGGPKPTTRSFLDALAELM